MTLSTPGWHVTGSSVAGTSHLRKGLGCDDAYLYRTPDEQDLLLIAVADGAGSAKYGAHGATTAVQAAIEQAERLLLRQIEPFEHDQWLSALTGIFTFSHKALVQRAREPLSEEYDATTPAPLLRDFATTLLLAIVTTHWIAVAQIGDGAVVIQYQNGPLNSLTPPRQEGYINETNFLTQSGYAEYTHYTVLPRLKLKGLALLTDGLELLAMHFPDNTPHEPFFNSLFQFAASSEANPAELQQFLSSERVCARTDDDKTLVLAVYQ